MTLKLSEAIRLGAMLHPQGFEYFLENDRTCALGAAAIAGGYRLHHQQTDMPSGMRTLFEVLTDYRDYSCPTCSQSRCGVQVIIVHLNDTHRWTREAIADWVEGIESERHPADEIASPTNAVREETGEPVLTPRA